MLDLVVVGSGVAGVATALGATGYRVLLVDQLRGAPTVHKGEFLQPRTLEVLREWGVLDKLVARGAIRLDGLECRDADGTALGMFDYRVLPVSHNYALAHYYAEIRAAMLSRLPGSVDVELGSRVTDLLRDGDGRVTGVEITTRRVRHRVSAELVVAADGPNSLLRKRIGLPSARYQYPHGFLGFDLFADRLPTHIVNFLTRDGARILYPMPGGRARLYVQVPRGTVADARGRSPAQWRASLARSCPGLVTLLDPWPELAPPQGFSAYRAMTTCWTAPGLALVGEAAHSVHPMAGQGMNTSIMDGWFLGTAIAEADGSLRNRVDAAVGEYERSRPPQVRRAAHMSDRLSRLCTTTSPIGVRLIRAVLRRNRGNARLRLEASLRLAGLIDEALPRRHLLGLLTGA